MKTSLFCDVMRRILIATDISGKLIPLKRKPTDCPETSLTVNLRCVTSQGAKYIIKFASQHRSSVFLTPPCLLFNEQRWRHPWRYSRMGVRLTTRFRLFPRLRMVGQFLSSPLRLHASCRDKFACTLKTEVNLQSLKSDPIS